MACEKHALGDGVRILEYEACPECLHNAVEALAAIPVPSCPAHGRSGMRLRAERLPESIHYCAHCEADAEVRADETAARKVADLAELFEVWVSGILNGQPTQHRRLAFVAAATLFLREVRK